MSLSFEQIEKLIKEFETSNLTELKVTGWHSGLELKKGNNIDNIAFVPSNNVPVVSAGNQVNSAANTASGTQNTNQNASGDQTAVAQTDAAQADTAKSGQSVDASDEKSDTVSENAVELKAPLAGVFYRAPKPGEKPYIEVGQTVKKGDTVGLMEAMKMISEIPSPCDGKVISIEAEDGKFAEYDSVIMKIQKY